MTDTIAFYHNPQSRGRIVHWSEALMAKSA
jgi:hypothetical protein